MTTGRPHHHGNTDSFAPSRPKTTSRPRPRPNSSPYPIVSPNSATDAIAGLNIGADPYVTKVINRVNVHIGSISISASLNGSAIETHLQSLVSLLQPIAKVAEQKDKLNSPGNKKERNEDDDEANEYEDED